MQPYGNLVTGSQLIGPPDQVGPSISEFPVVFFDDFTDGWGFEQGDADNTGKFSETANLGQWLVTVVDSGGDNGDIIVCSDAAPGGWLTITTNDAALDSNILQLNGEAFKLQAGKQTIMEARLKLSTVDTDWFVGLAATLVTAESDNPDFVGVGNTDATADIHAVTGQNAASGEIADIADRSGYTATDTGSNWVADTFVTLRFEADGVSSVRCYVDGALKATHTADICDDVTLTPTIITKVNAAATGVETMNLDYIYVAQSR